MLFFSLEMSQSEVIQRLIAAEARVSTEHLRTGQINDNDWSRINKAIGRLGDLPLWFDDSPSMSVLEIRAKSRRRHSAAGGLALVVVDYLQLLLSNSYRNENRQVEVAEFSRSLKILARELNCPVLALSQLSRAPETRQDKRPMLADLRESGAIEQDADVVMFLYRDEVYHADSKDRGIAEINIAKHRSGPTGMIKLVFLPNYTKFVDAPGTPPEGPPGGQSIPRTINTRGNSKQEQTPRILSKVACRAPINCLSFLRKPLNMYLLGNDLLQWLILAFGGALALGNLLALVRPRPAGNDGDPVRPPLLRSLTMVVLGTLAAIWAFASLLVG